MENSGDTINFSAIMLIALVVTVFLLGYFIIFRQLKAYTHKTSNRWDEFMVDLFKFPLLWLMAWIMLKLFANLFLKEMNLFRYLMHANNIVLIFSVGWMLMKFVKLGAFLLQKKLDISNSDNLHARRRLTQLNIFQNIANTIIVIITVALVLMTFESARVIGRSLLTSAGIAGIIIGFAAQKSIGMFLAGIQIAITQPISLDDVVTVEGEFGRVEEITLTYVVVKIWDERRLMLPVTYFLEKPFQNWTRNNSQILGTVYFFVGHNLSVEAIRNFVPGILKDNPNWDTRVFNVQITDTKEYYKEMRILVSSSDSSKSWDLRTEIREKVIDFIQTNYPDSFVKVPLYSQQTMDKVKVE